MRLVCKCCGTKKGSEREFPMYITCEWCNKQIAKRNNGAEPIRAALLPMDTRIPIRLAKLLTSNQDAISLVAQINAIETPKPTKALPSIAITKSCAIAKMRVPTEAVKQKINNDFLEPNLSINNPDGICITPYAMK